MGVHVCLPLFGHPGRELEEGRPLEGKALRRLAEQLGERLERAAGYLDQLKEAGWKAEVGMYDAVLSCRGVETREEAEKRLQGLGIPPEELIIIEDVDEDELT